MQKPTNKRTDNYNDALIYDVERKIEKEKTFFGMITNLKDLSQ